MNLCTYWLAAWLFGSALMMLLDERYVTRRRMVRYIVSWLAYCLLCHLLQVFVPEGLPHRLMPLAPALLFLVYVVRVARRVFLTFRRAARMLDDYYSYDAAAYIRWMSVFTYWAIVFGCGQGVFTFVPDRYVYVWILSAIPFYIYLYVSYANYLLFYEQVAGAFAEPSSPDEEKQSCDDQQPDGDMQETSCRATPRMSQNQEEALEQQIKEWVQHRGFTTTGLTIMDVARDTGTNRTYVSQFVSTHYGTSFREWVNTLRLDYAKKLMREHPAMPVSEVAQRAGYLSLSHFTRTFKESEGVTPGRWDRSC